MLIVPYREKLHEMQKLKIRKQKIFQIVFAESFTQLAKRSKLITVAEKMHAELKILTNHAFWCKCHQIWMSNKEDIKIWRFYLLFFF